MKRESLTVDMIYIPRTEYEELLEVKKEVDDARKATINNGTKRNSSKSTRIADNNGSDGGDESVGIKDA